MIFQVGWARERWTDPLFTKTLPTLAESGYLARGCKIWLPNLQCIEDSIGDFYGELTPYYTIRKESNPKANPLYRATEKVEKELLMCPDALTNETQLRPLLDFSSEPFYVLELRPIFQKTPTTPQSVKKAVAAPAQSSTKKRRAVHAVVDSSASENEATDAEDKITSLPNAKRQKKVIVGRSLSAHMQLA